MIDPARNLLFVARREFRVAQLSMGVDHIGGGRVDGELADPLLRHDLEAVVAVLDHLAVAGQPAKPDAQPRARASSTAACSSR